MASLVQLWLPILLSAVLVFIARSVLHMVLKFWDMPDCRGFSNEDEVRAAMRKGRNGTWQRAMVFLRFYRMCWNAARVMLGKSPATH